MRITITIPDELEKKIENYRKKNYPHLKKISRMILQIFMDKVNEGKR